MGNPLKIRKYQGSQVVDQGFPNDGTTDNGYTGNNPGIVGGIQEQSDQIECQVCILVKGNGTISADTASTGVTGSGTNFTTDAFTADSQIWVSDGNGGYTSIGSWNLTTDDTDLVLDANAAVALSGSAWFYTVVSSAGSVVRQKGSRTFLVVANNNNIQDESIAAGQAYMIATVSDTDWAALGADPTAGQYDIFTASKSGHGLGTNGVVWAVGTCLLVDSATPSAPNTMSIGVNDGSGTTYASRIKNHFSINFNTPYANANPGDTYVATFFTRGSVDPATGLTTATTENWC
jgi:hypothetical protein